MRINGLARGVGILAVMTPITSPFAEFEGASSMSKILVVVYSYTGTCRRLADLLCVHGPRGPGRQLHDAAAGLR
jgi:hypothetical protein